MTVTVFLFPACPASGLCAGCELKAGRQQMGSPKLAPVGQQGERHCAASPICVPRGTWTPENPWIR